MIVPKQAARAAARNAPDLPGVYFFYGENKQILYIGKAKNLRKRLLQHFPETTRLYDRPARQQVAAATTKWLSWIAAETELHALVLEDSMIKQHLPIVNKQHKKTLLKEYVGIVKSDPPSMVSFKASGPVPQKVDDYYGPFSDGYVTKDVIEIGCRYFGLDGGRRGGLASVSAGSSGTPWLEELRSFLSAADDRVISRIESVMKRHASANQFELASKARDDLEFCRRYLDRQGFFRRFLDCRLIIQRRVQGGQTWLFTRGKLIMYEAGGLLQSELNSRLQNPALRNEAPEPDWLLHDRAHIVRSWLRKNQADYEYRFEPI